MNNFRTEVNTVKSDFSILHETPLMLIGSCFAENIGSCLRDLKFRIDINPFGVLFNPISIGKSIERLINAKNFEEDDIFMFDDSWHSFMHHSRFSNKNKEKCLFEINQRLEEGHENLKNSEYLIITFGTSWVFENKANKQIVSNCHKLPAKNFERQLIESSTIVKIYEKIFKSLKDFNPNLKIILTLSPVRHLSDTAEGNQLSKAILIVALHELCKKGVATYFPAYEIMLDDLRDYRFYNTDMLHPSQQAVDYIFEKFGSSYFNAETGKINSEVSSILSAYNHRPVNLHSTTFKNFVGQNLEKVAKLENKYPFLDFSVEKEHFGKYK
jgi:hypothetical protein